MGKQKTQVEREIALRVGARIRQLREIQHVSQIQLATEIGIRAGPLGWIEKGKHLPSGRVLYRVAQKLNVRIDDLFEENNIWQPLVPSRINSSLIMLPPVRGCKSVTAESVKSAHIICQSVATRLLELEELCGVLKISEIPLQIPFTSTQQGAEHLSIQLRQFLGNSHAIGYEYLGLFENAGVRLICIDLPEECAAFAGYDLHTRKAFLFVNNRLKKRPELQMSSLLFELGRIFWHTRTLGAELDKQLHPNHTNDLLNETEFATCFTSFFLMPTSAMQATVWQLGISPETWNWEMLLRMKKRYGVSARSFAIRLQELKLSWSDQQKKNAQYYLFKDELDAFHEENGDEVEPGGNRALLSMNTRIGDLVLKAEQYDEKAKSSAVYAIKRTLRQAGVKLSL